MNWYMKLKLNDGGIIKFEQLYDVTIDYCYSVNLSCCKHRYVWLGRKELRRLTRAIGMNLHYGINIMVDRRDDGLARVFNEYFETIEECVQRKEFIYETCTKLR